MSEQRNRSLLPSFALIFTFFLAVIFISNVDQHQLNIASAYPPPQTTRRPRSYNHIINLPMLMKFPVYFTNSYYMQTTNIPMHQTKGSSLGTILNTGGIPRNIVIILDYGDPVIKNGSYGTDLLLNNVFASTASIKSAVINFATSFYNSLGTNQSHLNILVATNNSRTKDGINFVNYNHGVAWAQMINEASDYLWAHRGSDGNPFATKVIVSGASDMEAAYNDTYSTTAWVNGYVSSQYYPLYNIGNAPCPWVPPFSGNVSCEHGWDQNIVWYVSKGAGTNIFAIPEIYNTLGVNAWQWFYVSQYGYIYKNGRKIDFSGSLTEYGACLQRGNCNGIDNKPTHGWWQLWSALHTNNALETNGYLWLTDISYYP